MTRPLSPAEEARRQADATGREFTERLRVALGSDFPDSSLGELDSLLRQVMADEYEAGYATGYAQHPGNARPARA